MAEITAGLIELRARTSVGMMDCKRRSSNAAAIDKAVDYLREGSLPRRPKADRNAAQGMIFSYIHSNAKLGVLVELNCETDFVARTEEFQHLGHEIAMQIAAANPTYIVPEDVPQSIVDHESKSSGAGREGQARKDARQDRGRPHQ